MRQKLVAFLEDRRFEWAITALIIVNAITLGLETSPAIMANHGPALHLIDRALLAVFVVELLAKVAAYGPRFFKSGWNVFDFLVVAIALVPATGPLSVLRALRILRVLRLITIIPSLKRVVGAMIKALPGMGSIMVLLLLVFYVSAVMATKLFQSTEPEAFGSLDRSLYTLFQLMTLDGWSGEIVKPVLDDHPLAMLFFLPFILFSAFVVLNLFIGVVVGAMQDEATEIIEAVDDTVETHEQVMLREIKALRDEVQALRARLET
jgi:voltage-gated sodium channel